MDVYNIKKMTKISKNFTSVKLCIFSAELCKLKPSK